MLNKKAKPQMHHSLILSQHNEAIKGLCLNKMQLKTSKIMIH